MVLDINKLRALIRPSGAGWPPPSYGENYIIFRKNGGKLREKKKNQGKRRKFRGSTEKIRKNNEKENIIFKKLFQKIRKF